MQFIRKYWLQIQAFLDRLPRDTKWLIIAMTALLAIVGFVVLQYAASPEMVALHQVAPERMDRVIARLQAAGIDAEAVNGVISVPQEKQTEALAVLAQSDLLATDTSGAFDRMIERQSPWMSNDQNRQNYLLAKQKVLGTIIGKMSGVRSADVIISEPKREGFGDAYSRPSASVNVVMDGGRRVNRHLVEAVAGLVSGAAVPMQPQDVVVIDANQGRQHTVKDPADIAPSETMELVQAQEQRYREKIEDILGYIQGVRVAVNVRTDSVLSRHREAWEYGKETISREQASETERINTQNAGEPGVGSNVGMDIRGSAGSSIRETTSETENEYDSPQLTAREVVTSRGRMVKEVRVTVNVPRTYFVGLHRQQNPPTEGQQADPPGDDQLRPIVDQQLEQIREQVLTQISSQDMQGVVVAHMIPDAAQLARVLSPEQPPTGVQMVLESEMVRYGGLATLVLMSLGIMFGMVRKAMQQPQLPTVEELAGLPPILPEDEDLIGEAGEEQTAMAGVELDEEEVRSRRIAEQISDLVQSNPTEAASLVSRWLRTED